MKTSAVAVLLASFMLAGGQSVASTAPTTSPSQDCRQPGAERLVKFAFMNFTGQQVRLAIDDHVVVDGTLSTKDWSTALSHYLTHPISDDARFVVSVDGSAIYADRLAGADICTIYVDARPSGDISAVQQTAHPSPLLD